MVGDEAGSLFPVGSGRPRLEVMVTHALRLTSAGSRVLEVLGPVLVEARGPYIIAGRAAHDRDVMRRVPGGWRDR